MPQPHPPRLAAMSLPALFSLVSVVPLTLAAPPPASSAHTYAPVTNAASPCKVTAPTEGGPDAARTSVDLLAAMPPSDVLMLVDGKRLFGEVIPRVLGGRADLRAAFDAALKDAQAVTGLDPSAAGRVMTGGSFQKAAAPDGWDFSWVGVTRDIAYASWLSGIRQRKPGALRETRHAGKTVHLLALTDGEKGRVEFITMLPLGGNELAFAALDADAVAFGTPAGVRRSIDACAGSGPRISAELAAAAARAPEALLSAAGMLPPWLTADILPVDQRVSAEFRQAFSSLKQLHFSAASTPEGFAFTVVGDTGGAGQAKTLGDILTAINTLAAVAPGTTARDQSRRELFKGASVSATGAEVRIRIELTQPAAHLWVKRLWADSLVTRGHHLEKAGFPEAAGDDFTRAIELDPDNVMAYIHRAGVRSDKGDLDAALADHDKALALDPHNVTAYNNRGLLRVRKGEYDAALADLDKAIALDPTDAYAYNNRGLARSGKGNVAEALDDFDKAIALAPKLALAYSNRGFVRQRQGDAERAVADFDKSLALDPNLADAYNGRGYSRIELGDYDAAIADFEKAVALNPKSADAFNGRGLARYYKDELDAALADYDKALALEPAAAIVYYNRGLARADQEAFEQAVADFDKAIALAPELADAYSGRGITRYRRGDFKHALVDFDKAITIRADYAEPHCYRALSQLELKQDAEAYRGLKKCFELDPASRPAYEALADEIIESRRRKSRRAH